MVWVVSLTVAVVSGVGGAPAGAAPQPFTLQMPDGGGELLLRGSEEPSILESPTLISGTADDETGAIAGDFSTPTIQTERIVTASGVTALAAIDATFTPETPGSTTGSINSDGDLALQTRLTVDLHIDVFLNPDGPVSFSADCVTTPVVLTMESTAPYTPDGGGSVTVADEDFTIPPIEEDPACAAIVRDALQEQLAGSGHSLSLDLTGVLPVPEDCEADTVTTLAVDPAGQSRVGEAITIEATVAAAPGATEPGPPAGLVNFLADGDVIGTGTLDGSGIASFTTSTLPSGSIPLEARYQGQTPFCRSASAPTAHVVAPDPTVVSTLPEFVAIGGDGTEFDLIITNPAGGGSVATPGVVATFARSTPASLSGLHLERKVGDDFVEVPLTFPQANTATGSAADAAWAPLDPGDQVVIRLRVSAEATVAPGVLTATFALVDDVMAEDPAELATSQAPTTLINTDRLPSTVAAFTGVVPRIVRQGNVFMIRAITINPSVGSQQATGQFRLFLNGVQLPLRGLNTHIDKGFAPSVPVAEGLGGVSARVPANQSGVLPLVLDYSGSNFLLPSQAAFTIDIRTAVGPAFECTTNHADVPVNGGFNLQVLAGVPSSAPSGSTVPLTNMYLRALWDRGPSPLRLGVPTSAGEHTIDGTTLAGIELELGPEGSGAATGYTAANTTTMSNTNPPADPDLTFLFAGETGSVDVTGDPGDVVPVTLGGINFNFIDPIGGGIPFTLTCTPLAGPITLGQITVAGATLAVDAPEPARAGDDVTLVADVAPDAGTVEFFDGETSIGVAPVVDGQAVRITDDLPAGEHTIVARHTSARWTITTNAVDLRVLDTYDCGQYAQPGNAAVVRLVYMELLSRCPDQAGFDHWVGRLDGGTSPTVFARSISRTPEAVGRVVDDAYAAMLDRAADAAGRAFWVERMRTGGGRYDQLLADLAASPEFWILSGSTRAGFVTRVYDRLLERAPEPGGLEYWTDRLAGGTSRRALVLTLANLPEPLSHLVAAAYEEILDRPPVAGEQSNGSTYLRGTGDRSGLYAELIGRLEFAARAHSLPNFTGG